MPRAIGKVATSATTEVPVNATTYNEQTTGAQRSVKSSSANDTAAGTGARKVRIKYFTLASDGTIAGPFFETVTLNGVTAVATVATNICLVELFEVMTAGSGGVAAGTITLYDDNVGAGTAICSIAVGAVRTFLSVHYVPTGRLCRVTDIEAIGGDAAAALVQLKAAPYPLGIEKPITGQYGVTSTLSRGAILRDSEHSPIPGPARLRMLVTPGNANGQTTVASYGYVDEATK